MASTPFTQSPTQPRGSGGVAVQAAAVLLDVPGAGQQAVAFVDSVNQELSLRGTDGRVRGRAFNQSTGPQSPSATTRTYLDGSALRVPTAGLQVGTQLRWKFNLTKTASGTATSTIDIAIGTAGTTADTAQLSFVKPAGTSVADEGTITVEATVRSIGATGTLVAQFSMVHNLSATGHMTIPAACVNVISGSVDLTVANLIVGLCITTGSGDAVSIQLVQSEMWNV